MALVLLYAHACFRAKERVVLYVGHLGCIKTGVEVLSL